ncbi:hypothetical protein [Limnoglobus roseus]|uniref:Uncharacterized protein n=1 Tax=Limnoglobus roseus TaxID=2598579 RepID=A0A5C1ACT7_9BACT|nr:hypothetical protein [Limnoglobus roseus]QEL16455.1 hypothetical protein PX52LOC_03409 [Limnoglobus roseus]
MNRRRAIGVGAGSGWALTGAAGGRPSAASELKVSVVLPGLYGLDGTLAHPPTLRNAGYGLRFVVVVENVSPAAVYVWAEGNSEGHGTLSFEVAAGRAASTVRRVEKEWSKNVVRLERLAPGGLHARVVAYDPPAGAPREWEGWPFGAKDSRVEVTLRAVFEQAKAGAGGKVMPWAGRVVSPEYKVTLLNA